MYRLRFGSMKNPSFGQHLDNVAADDKKSSNFQYHVACPGIGRGHDPAVRTV